MSSTLRERTVLPPENPADLVRFARGLADAEAPARAKLVGRSFPDALVTGYESLIDGMTNHPKGRHVLAAAARASAEVIVTFNLSDFPEPALKPYDIAAIHPDDYLLDRREMGSFLAGTGRG